MTRKLNIFFTNSPFLLPDLLILISTSISSFYEQTALLNIIILYSTMFFSGTFLLYQIIYYWRNLVMSFLSFILFSINILQLCLYLWTFKFLILGLPHPIYLKDLSVFAQYRYLVLFSITVVFIMLYLLSLVFKLNIQKYLSALSHPYLHEEICYLLDSWKDAHIGKFFLSFIHNLSRLAYYRYLYASLDLLCVLFRVIIVLFFISFCFFNGAFDPILYLSPITFLFWLLSVVIYYINWVIEENSTVIHKWLQLSPVVSDLMPSDKLCFSLQITAEGYKQGFTEHDIPFLVGKWLILSNLVGFFQYRRFVKYFSFGIVTSYLVSWCYITYYFFYIPSDIMYNGLPSLGAVFRRSLIWKPPTRSPRDVRFLYEGYHNPVKVNSQNEFAVGHPVYGELLADGTYRIDGYITRNPNYGVNILKTPNCC